MKRVRNIRPRPVRWHGVTHHLEPHGTYHADIVPGESIRLFGNERNDGVAFDRTFTIGDVVEYDSYNLSYTAPIVAIGPKTVTVDDHGRRHRLDLHTFAWRNCDLDLERIARNNADTLMHI